jgi:transposase
LIRKAPRECDFVLCRERNLVERFFNKIKHFRAKLARNFLAAVQLISAMVLLN